MWKKELEEGNADVPPSLQSDTSFNNWYISRPNLKQPKAENNATMIAFSPLTTT